MDKELERDCLFQLNLLVWASYPLPPGGSITSVLYDADYRLVAVEQPLDASVAEQAMLKRVRAGAALSPVADLVLRHDPEKVVVLLECKPGSFDVGSKWTRQARGLLAAGGGIESRLALASIMDGEVAYAVPADAVLATVTTLEAIAQDLRKKKVPCCPVNAVGVQVDSEGAYLTCPATAARGGTVSSRVTPRKQVLTRKADQDIRPLYVIPWIPNAPSAIDYDRFGERTRAHLLAWLGRATVGKRNNLGFEQLLDSISWGLFSKWRNRDSLRGEMFPVMGKVVQALFGQDHRVSVGRTAIEVDLVFEKDRESLLERVRRASVPKKLPEGIQPTLPVNETGKRRRSDSR